MRVRWCVCIAYLVEFVGDVEGDALPERNVDGVDYVEVARREVGLPRHVVFASVRPPMTT